MRKRGHLVSATDSHIDEPDVAFQSEAPIQICRKRAFASVRFLDAQQTNALLLLGTNHQLDFCLFSHLQSIIHLNTKVAYGALQFGVTKK